MIDFSELEGKSYTCLDGCAMCCLCQPELSDEELKVFETDEFLRGGLTREHFDGRRTARPTALKLQGDRGACHFLKNRRCTIHEIKPHFCRQFPVHVHILNRIQLNANLSCRGITNGGTSLKTYGKSLITGIPERMLNDTLSMAKRVVHDFDENCRRAGIHQSPERMRKTVGKLMPLLGGPDGVGKVLAYADDEPEVGDEPEQQIVENIMMTPEATDLDKIARESNYEQFELDDIARLPVYVDEEFRWNIFQSKDGRIRWMMLEEDGDLVQLATIDPAEVKLLPRNDDAMRIFTDYAALLNNRDAFLGNVMNVCDQHDYRHDLMTVYLGVLGTSMLDLWWRASLLGKMKRHDRIDAWLAGEAVKAYDMDCLDSPTLGAFI